MNANTVSVGVCVFYPVSIFKFVSIMLKSTKASQLDVICSILLACIPCKHIYTMSMKHFNRYFLCTFPSFCVAAAAAAAADAVSPANRFLVCDKMKYIRGDKITSQPLSHFRCEERAFTLINLSIEC